MLGRAVLTWDIEAWTRKPSAVYQPIFFDNDIAFTAQEDISSCHAVGGLPCDSTAIVLFTGQYSAYIDFRDLDEAIADGDSYFTQIESASLRLDTYLEGQPVGYLTSGSSLVTPRGFFTADIEVKDFGAVPYLVTQGGFPFGPFTAFSTFDNGIDFINVGLGEVFHASNLGAGFVEPPDFGLGTFWRAFSGVMAQGACSPSEVCASFPFYEEICGDPVCESNAIYFSGVSTLRDAASVPPPAPLLLLASAFALLFGVRRRDAGRCGRAARIQP